MKIILIAIASLLITGCNITPKNYDGYSKDISVSHDDFKKITKIKSGSYLLGVENNLVTPVEVNFRAFGKKGIGFSPQLYVFTGASSWAFYDTAYGQNGEEYNVTQISRDVSSGTWVNETIGIDFTLEQLEKISHKDWKVEISGKKGKTVIMIPADMSKSFFDKIKIMSK